MNGKSDGLSSTGKMKIHFGSMNDSAEDYYYIQIGTSTASALGVGNQAVEGSKARTVSTQEAAQQALVGLNDAVVSKDKIRAHLGALQNRLENTISNLTTQTQNLQAAESRISDVDVATEMTAFVRNQILTQSAVAMLSQANSMPQMAMQLIGR
jgi:flagellin